MSSPSAKEEADSAGVKLDKVNDVADAPRLTSSQSEQAITAAEGRGDSGKKKRKRKKDRKKDGRKEKKRKRRSKSGGVSTREKRVRHELAGIIRDPPFNVSAGPKSEDNIFDWYSVIKGPEGSPYANGVFYLDIHFPKDYPFVPPEVKFRTKIYHCNIDRKGNICVSILKDQWSAALTISKVLISVTSLLTDANPADPLVKDIAKQYIKDREGHDAMARLWTKKYASPTNGAGAAAEA